MEEVQGGYIAVRAGEILSLLAAYKEGLRPSCIRLYLAAHLEATEQLFTPAYQITLGSLCQRANLAYRTGQDAIRELEAAELITLSGGVITFTSTVIPQAMPYLKDLGTSQDRPVPIPPSLMRLLAKHQTGSEIITALAHLLRCLFINRGTIKRTGFIKNSLITKLTGLGERAIQGARNWMIKVGFIITKAVKKKFTNKHGGCFVVKATKPQGIPIPAPLSSTYVGSAPPLESTPIYINNDLNNQYTPSIDEIPTVESGVCKQTIKTPIITDIKPENLHSLSALDTLYSQAIERKWFTHTENQPLEFLAAAVRAISTPAHDPVRVFVSLVKRGLTAHITQAQEVRAQEKLSAYRRRHPEAFRPKNQSPPIPTQAPPRPRVIPQVRKPVEAKPKTLMETITDVIKPLNLLAQLEAKLKSFSASG